MTPIQASEASPSRGKVMSGGWFCDPTDYLKRVSQISIFVVYHQLKKKRGIFQNFKKVEEQLVATSARWA